jgi:endonuclease/exonuclease/phosphatase family metal-dependent hydrolase
VHKIIAATALSLACALPLLLQPAAAPAASVGPVDLRVASFNVQSVSLDKTVGNQRPWKQRRGTVISQILAERPDVLGVQEVNPSRTFSSRLVDGPTQYYDLRNGLDKAGGTYQLTNGAAFNCVRPDTSYKCVYRNRGASYGDRILFNRETVALLSQGSTRYTVQGPGADTRYVVWAVFRQLATGHDFVFVSTHLRAGAQSVRHAQWQQLISRVNALRRGRPVVVVGDFNTQKFDPLAQQMLPAMHAAGYGDVLGQQYAVNPVAHPRAQGTVDAWVNSWNRLDRDMRPWSYDERRDKTGNMIDWVFATNSLPVKEFKLVVDYDPSTLAVRGVFPSDHNMVRATLSLP